ncbi:OmpA family protein [Nocardiopsis sp. RSe5-2]|uniref:OmpA family protein n=1 Tax=Nocardiopsis endophytica TaxID=3018445 RepID=A0ABT4U9U3_9ACTN|nr:OmpA family protein [Nocardiopsis endophytica]MDA2813737.1 OmpA family protein [Nocardiopsis endophytica]
MSRRAAGPRTLGAGAVGAALALALTPAAAADTGEVAGDPDDVTPETIADAVIPIDPAPSVIGIDPSESVEELETEKSEGGTTTVTIAADVLFAFDEASLTDAAQDTIADIAGRLEGAEGTVEVVGHSDGIGDDAYNQELSEKRAEAVKSAIEDELGSAAPDIEAEGRGSSEPVAEETDGDGNDVPSARAENRRVEISFEGG